MFYFFLICNSQMCKLIWSINFHNAMAHPNEGRAQILEADAAGLTSPARIQLNYYSEAKGGVECKNSHQCIWTILPHCCILPAFTFIHKSYYLLNAQHSSCENKHLVTHCRSTGTCDTASWDHLGLKQEKFHLMGQLLASTSLFGIPCAYCFVWSQVQEQQNATVFLSTALSTAPFNPWLELLEFLWRLLSL